MENTYVFFTSDNGGMEAAGTRFTQTTHDRGKISLKGRHPRAFYCRRTRIPRAVQSDVMVNGLDLYPTILTLTDSAMPKERFLMAVT